MNLLRENVHMATGIVVIGSQRVKKTVLKFQIRLMHTFSNSIYAKYMEK